jgi:hypothetical protein
MMMAVLDATGRDAMRMALVPSDSDGPASDVQWACVGFLIDRVIGRGCVCTSKNEMRHWLYISQGPHAAWTRLSVISVGTDTSESSSASLHVQHYGDSVYEYDCLSHTLTDHWLPYLCSMSPPFSKISKMRPTKKRKKTQGGKDESVADAQHIAKHRGRRRTASKRKLDLKEDVNRVVDSESFKVSNQSHRRGCRDAIAHVRSTQASSLSANHVSGPMFSGENTTIYGGQFIQANSVNYDMKSDEGLSSLTEP